MPRHALTGRGIWPGGNERQERFPQCPLSCGGRMPTGQHAARVVRQGAVPRTGLTERVVSTAFDRQICSEAKQVGAGLSNERFASAVIPLTRCVQPAHDRDRCSGKFALDEVGGGRNFIPRSHLGDDQLVAELVNAAAVVVEDRQPRGADRNIEHAVAPRTTLGVGDDDADP